MTTSDEENGTGLNAEDLKFFQKRSKFLSLSGFAQTDLLAAAPASKKQKGKRAPGALDQLEAAEDAQATALKKMQVTLQSKNKRESCDEDAEEDDFDRKFSKKYENMKEDTNASTIGLPVRSSTGQWNPVLMKSNKTLGAAKNSKKEDESSESEGEDEKTSAASTNAVTATEVEIPFEDAKERLALLAMEITENVDENMPKLKELLNHCKPGMRKDRVEDGEMVKMGLITVLAVFKDILPGYWIRPLTEAEKTAKIGKDVKKQRNFEESILRGYRQYIQRLEEILKTVKKGDSVLVPVAVGCFGELAISAGHFNYYERVLAALAGLVFNRNEITSGLAMKAVERVFSEDEIGRSTAHILRLISDSIQSRDYLPEKRAIEVLQSIRIKLLAFSKTDHLPSNRKIASEEAAKLAVYKKKAVHLSKSHKKQLKVDLAESIKLATSEAEYTREERAKWSSDSLKFLFRVLFGILKRFESICTTEKGNDKSKTDEASVIELLPTVMKLLAKCSQFLSVEFFPDLLLTLKRILKEIDEKQSFLTCLYTVQTILHISSLQLQQKTDMKYYFDLLYKQLRRIPTLNITAHDAELESEVETLLEAVMNKLFFSKESVPPTRVAAFVHSLTDVSVSVKSPKISIYLLRLAVRLLEIHDKARGILDDETLGRAAYLPKCMDPDLCNPFCKTLKLDLVVGGIEASKGKIIPKDLLQKIKKLQVV